MKKINILLLIVSLLLVFTVSCNTTVVPNEGNEHLCSSRCTKCGGCTDDDCTEAACLNKCTCNKFVSQNKEISYEALDVVLVDNGLTDYTIVIADDASQTIYNTITEFNYFMAASTNVTFNVIFDTGLVFSNDKKYISLGNNDLLNQVDFTEYTGLNNNGYAIKTIGNSIFICGSKEVGTLFGVYGLLKTLVNLECYSSKVYDITTTTTLKTPNINISCEPDIEFMAGCSGMVDNLTSMRLQIGGASFMYPVGGAQWHNSFDYFPIAEYQNEHPEWYASDQKNLCYTAHGDNDSFNELVEQTVEKMKDVINLYPTGNTLTFTHQDVSTWCTCSECTKWKNKYGTDSAVVIRFMNAVVEKVETWRKVAWPQRDNIVYLFFAYTACIEAPAYQDEAGNWKPIDEIVTPREKVGVIYAPILSDFIHSKTDDQNSQYEKHLDVWSTLCGGNLYLWYYQAYFYNYFVTYDNFNSMQEDYQSAKEYGCRWMYDQGPWDQKACTGFFDLKTYLQAKLRWNVNEDYNTLINNYFAATFKDAAPAMKDYFDAMHLHYTYLAEFEGMGGWIGNRINTSTYFSVNTLLEWESYFTKAYAAIEKYKDVNPTLYNQIYESILLESLSYRYLLIDLYGTEVYTADELYQVKLQFKNDCTRLNVSNYSEAVIISSFWSKWGI